MDHVEERRRVRAPGAEAGRQVTEAERKHIVTRRVDQVCQEPPVRAQLAYSYLDKVIRRFARKLRETARIAQTIAELGLVQQHAPDPLSRVDKNCLYSLPGTVRV